MRAYLTAAGCLAAGTAVVLMSMQAHAQEVRALPRLQVECDPLHPTLAKLLPDSTLRCGAGIQSYLGGDRRVSTLVVDKEGAVRGLLERGESAPALLIPDAPVAQFGDEEDTIYWGLWMPGQMREFAGTEEQSVNEMTVAQPYVGGITAAEYFRHDMVSGSATSATAVPTQGAATYELLGTPLIASRDEANFRSNIIEPGLIQGASVRVDFATGTAVARIRYSVRSASTETQLNLVRRKPPSTTFDAVSCTDTGFDICSSAELRFYGRQAQFAGLLFTINYNTAMPEAQRVAARLNNAKGRGAVALERR